MCKIHSHEQLAEIISTKHDLVKVESGLHSVENDMQSVRSRLSHTPLLSDSNDFKSTTMFMSIDVHELSTIRSEGEYKSNEAALNKYTVTLEKQQLEFSSRLLPWHALDN